MAGITAALICFLEVASRPLGLHYRAGGWLVLRIGLDAGAGVIAHSLAGGYAPPNLPPYLVAALAGAFGSAFIRSQVFTLGSGESAKTIGPGQPFDKVRLFLDVRIARATGRVRIKWLDQECVQGLAHRTIDEILARYLEELSLSGEKRDDDVARLISLARLQESPPCDDATAAVTEVPEGRTASRGDVSGRASSGLVESHDPHELRREVLLEITRKGGYKFLRRMVAEADRSAQQQ